MSEVDIIRAWKDETYRRSLSEAEKALLPENPAGLIELAEDELSYVAGGDTENLASIGCCGSLTRHVACLSFLAPPCWGIPTLRFDCPV